jgi:hypothetical protein
MDRPIPCLVVEFVAVRGSAERVTAAHNGRCVQTSRHRCASHGIHRKVESGTGKRDGGMSVLTNIQMSPAQVELSKIHAPSLAIPQGVIETDIPARLDSLPWSGFHTRVIAALGITWILDGLEVLHNQHWHRRATAVRRSDRHRLAQQHVAGYLPGSIVMAAAVFIAWRYCIDAERKSLEEIARPLAAQE